MEYLDNLLSQVDVHCKNSITQPNGWTGKRRKVWKSHIPRGPFFKKFLKVEVNSNLRNLVDELDETLSKYE